MRGGEGERKEGCDADAEPGRTCYVSRGIAERKERGRKGASVFGLIKWV